MKRNILLGLVMVLMSIIFIACTGSAPEYHKARVYTFEKERTINGSYETVWQKVIDWFATHNTPIKTLDKSSGIIASDYELSASSGNYIDCGDAVHGTENSFGIEVTNIRLENQRGNFNVSVKKVDDNSTKVNINFFARAELNQYNKNNGQLALSEKVTCNSNGTLEKEIFDAISR